MALLKTPILLVDDSRANILALEAVLESPDYELVSVASGSDALAELEQRDFAVILLDFQMPTMNGLETAKRMKASARRLGRHAPIIFVTAIDADRAQVLAAYASGAADIVKKPLEPAVLSAKVAVFADLYRARKVARRSVESVDEAQQRTELEADLTTRKFAEEDASRFRLLVESVKDYAIFILDPEGHVATWNTGAAGIKGYTATEIVGKHFSIFYPPADVAAGKCDHELALATHEGRFEEEGWRVRKDGSKFWANVTITALRASSGALVGFAKVTRDLTERLRHEAALRALAAETAALAEKDQIQVFQERFIAILGHDLRNPLSAIDMGAALLLQRAEHTKDDVGARILVRMKSSSRRMSRMIEQILDLTRTRLAGGIALKSATMDLCRTLTAIADELRTAHPTRAVELDCEPSTEGTWDRDRLEQVFSNLVGNAVHYGHPEHPVRVGVLDDGDNVVVRVHNQGPPIPETLRAELFSAFRRGERDSRTAETAGLGLGLYISREIVLAHGGDIEVDSSSTEGTTFRVTLPRNPRPLA